MSPRSWDWGGILEWVAGLLTYLLIWIAILFAGCYSDVDRGPSRMEVRVSNNFRDPVDVTVYCGYTRIGKARWIMRGSREIITVKAGSGCALRVVIRPSIEGGPLTRVEGFDSESHLHAARECAVLNITANPILAATYTMPGRCP